MTDADGQVVDRRSYDAWGKQRHFDWQGAGSLYSMRLLFTTRAYTDHESIEEVGLIHMNGRVYDASLARFISADPYIQAAGMSQSYSRYSYVQNNPMKYTDPSGYILKGLLKKAFGGLAGLVLGPSVAFHHQLVKKATRAVIRAVGPKIANLAATIGSAFCGPFAALCYAHAQYDIARAYGASPSEAARGAAVAGITYYLGQQASSWVGSTFDINAGAGQYALNVAANGVVGGTLAVAQGGKFGYGFVSSAFAAGAKSLNFDIWGKSANYKIHRTVTAAVIGGTASKLGGGKFANGAASAAFTHWHNTENTLAAQKAKVVSVTDKKGNTVYTLGKGTVIVNKGVTVKNTTDGDTIVDVLTVSEKIEKTIYVISGHRTKSTASEHYRVAVDLYVPGQTKTTTPALRDTIHDMNIFNRVASYHDKNTVHVDYKSTGNQGRFHDSGDGWVHIP